MKKVLVVDDHADIRRLIRMTLDFEDFEVREAPDGLEALAVLQGWTPDAILIDVMMPGMDGFTLCRTIREQPATRHIPVLFLSARGHARDTAEGLKAGASAYLIKPFSPLQLIHELSRASAKAA
ncbi:response regulator transcription factor [Roseateles terrae]|uniref:CheY-like chemotaxis protein n=1 Tax=Roseateles terrae TaxID=431060 RepID=A0ABR6GLW8_9BURK|nr:response regulator [Roseateles terrae]MBB3193101.1 CheY-like chemotaxis protein [Roseateles terrae]OWQ89665.1 two-component system response regulator [Roseateles terrae]